MNQILATALCMRGAMQDAQAFLARLDATTSIVTVLAGRPEFDKVVENEKRELLLIIDNVPVSGHNAATIIKAVKSAKLPQNTEETVIARIVQLLSTPRPFPPAIHASGQPSNRGGSHNVGISHQDFTSIINYMTNRLQPPPAQTIPNPCSWS